MRVVLYNDAPGFAGTESHICTLAAELPAFGVEAVVACGRGAELGRRAAAEGLDVWELPDGPVWAAAAELARRLRARPAQIVHAHSGRSAAAAVLAAARAGCRGVKTQHFIRPAHEGRAAPLRWLSRLAHRRVNRRLVAFIAISQAVRREMLRRGEAAAQRVTVVPNGIRPADRLPPAAARRLRQELGLAAGRPWVTCVARLEREKDVGGLVTAMGLVAAALPAAVCTVAGEGALRGALEKQIDSAGLGEVVRLLGFRRDARALVEAADLFVLPSRSEPFGLAILEAMEAGKAVVSTAAGGPLEIVEEGRTGLLVPPGDPPALADAIAALLADEPRRARMGSEARRRFAERFTARAMAEATAAVYRRAAAGGEGAGGGEREAVGDGGR